MNTELIVDRAQLYAVIMGMEFEEQDKNVVLLYTKSLKKAQALFDLHVKNPPIKDRQDPDPWYARHLYIVTIPLGQNLEEYTLTEDHEIARHNFKAISTESKDALNEIDSVVISAENKVIISLSTTDGGDLLFLLLAEEEYETQWKALLDQAPKVHARTSSRHAWITWDNKITHLIYKLSNTKKFYNRDSLKLTGPIVNFVHVNRFGFWTLEM